MSIYLKLVFGAAVVLINGCITTRDYVGIEPVYPMPHNNLGHATFEGFPVVESLQPTLQWERVKTAGFSYDLAIWEKPDSTDIKHVGINYNDPEYYVEGIKDAQHKVASPLRPNTVYMWTVRARKQGDVGKWAAYKEKTIMPGGWRDIWNVPFSFKTPEK